MVAIKWKKIWQKFNIAKLPTAPKQCSHFISRKQEWMLNLVTRPLTELCMAGQPGNNVSHCASHLCLDRDWVLLLRGALGCCISASWHPCHMRFPIQGLVVWGDLKVSAGCACGMSSLGTWQWIFTIHYKLYQGSLCVPISMTEIVRE